MLVKEFKLGNTIIEVDDEFYPKTMEDNEVIYQEFNKVGWEIFHLENERRYNKWKIYKNHGYEIWNM